MKTVRNILIFIDSYLLRLLWMNKRIAGIRPFIVKQLKIFFITAESFTENRVVLQASALTYYSVMAVVPTVAMAFGIAKGFGLEQLLREELTSRLEGQKEVLVWVIKFANSLLEKTQGGIVAGVGVFVILWSIMQVLSNVEASFNNVWQVKRGRSFYRKFTDYTAIMLIAPIFIILSSSVTVYISTQIQNIVKSIEVLGYLSPVIRVFINLIPYVLIWALFTMVFLVIPNTKVKIKPAIISGIIAGTIFQISQWLYFKFQIGVSNYNAVYGSFAALPLFMLWVQTGWLIVLFGAEMCYATQNYEKYEFDRISKRLSYRYKRAMYLLVAAFIVKKFDTGEPPAGIDEMSHKLLLPQRMVQKLVNELADAKIVSQVVYADSNDEYYQPASDINKLSIRIVLDKIESVGTEDAMIAQVPDFESIQSKLSSFNELAAKSDFNKLLKDI
jgi:membrane protein